MSQEPRHLRDRLRQHTLGTALVPLLVVEGSLLALYLVLGQQLAARWQHQVESTLHEHLDGTVRTRADQLSLTLEGVERQTEQVRTQAELLFSGRVPAPSYTPEDYARGANGALYQKTDIGGTSVFYASSTPFGPEQQERVALTQLLDPALVAAVDDDPTVVAAYINTHDDLNRIYPFIPDAADQFPGDMQMEDFAFYYEADAVHDPGREVVWTDAYLDPAGAGWMVSSVAPVYRGDMLEAVVGLDVTVTVLAEQALDLDHQHEALALLLTGEGRLLALNRVAAEHLGRTDLLEAAPDGVDDHEVKLHGEASITALFDEPAQLAALLAGRPDDAPMAEIDIDGAPHYALARSLGRPDWRYVVLVPRESVLAPVRQVESQSRTVAFLVVGAMGLFYAVFFGLIYRRAVHMAATIEKPLAALAEATATTDGRLQDSRGALEAAQSDIVEIQSLATRFGAMLGEVVRHRTELETLNQTLADEVDRQVASNREKDHQLVEQGRLAAMGEMVAAIAHQWRQPLMGLQLQVDEVRHQAGPAAPDAIAGALDSADMLIHHLDITIEDFLGLYRPVEPAADVAAIERVVRRVTRIAEGALKEAPTTLVFEIPDDVGAIDVKPASALAHILLNLVGNAIAMARERGVEAPRIVVRAHATASRLRLEVEDNAGGVDPALGSRIFEPYVTTRADGTGLGLHMSRRLAEEALGGSLSLREGEAGARFVLQLSRP